MVVDYYNKDILLWGIERAGHRSEEFLVKESYLSDWLHDIKLPTVKQLETVAKKIHLPFGYLFLDTPPKETLNFPFFRTEGNQTTVKNVSLNVYETIQIIENRQIWLKEYLLQNGNIPLPFVGKFKTSNKPVDVARDIRSILNLSELWANRCDTWEDALNFLTDVIESVGIIISYNGVVGNSNKRKIPVNECRGFVLVDNIVPFMFINNSDAKAAQIFTIAHELAHIWIGQSAGFDFRNMSPANDDKEIFCDSVAAEFLIPAELLKNQWRKNQDFQVLNRFFKVSPIVVARRALDLGFINKAAFFKFYNEYIRNEFHKKKDASGGNFYFTMKKRISPTFAAYVDNGVRSGRLLYKDAYKLTGMHGDTFSEFFKRI